MNNNTLFCHLSSIGIAKKIHSAKEFVCFAGPGIQIEPALAMSELSERLGPEMITVSLDFDENVMRMGYGDIKAVECLKKSNIIVNHAPDLRSALIIIDNEGYVFSPTPLYLEAESNNNEIRNALRLTKDQVDEALARLSPAAKAIAIAQADDLEEKIRIENIPVEVESVQVDEEQFKQVDKILELAPPVKFDLARQVRVFEPYLQYVELSMTGAAIQRHRLTIPSSIQQLGGNQDLEGRLRTTFDLIEKGGELSSKPLEDELNEMRKNFTPSLGKDHGRVVLKSAKPRLEKRIEEFKIKLINYQIKISEGLQAYLDESRKQIVDYYVPIVMDVEPDAVIGQSLTGKATEEGARYWLNEELNKVFPKKESLIKEMKLTVLFKDVTYETLNKDDFLKTVKKVFSGVDWDKAYNDFIAAAESD